MPSLCKKHSAQVGNYFDTDLARSFDVNSAECVVCKNVIRVEEARRYLGARQAWTASVYDSQPQGPALRRLSILGSADRGSAERRI